MESFNEHEVTRVQTPIPQESESNTVNNTPSPFSASEIVAMLSEEDTGYGCCSFTIFNLLLVWVDH